MPSELEKRKALDSRVRGNDESVVAAKCEFYRVALVYRCTRAEKSHVLAGARWLSIQASKPSVA
jgi:hypothetical protein